MQRVAFSNVEVDDAPLVLASELRNEVGLGSGDRTFDTLLTEMELTARQFIELELTYSVLPVIRTDYYTELSFPVRLTQQRDVSEDLEVNVFGFTQQEPDERNYALHTLGIEFFDDNSQGWGINIVASQQTALNALMLRKGNVANWLNVRYTTEIPVNRILVVTAIKKLVASMFAQQSLEPSELAKRTAMDLINRVHPMGGLSV